MIQNPQLWAPLSLEWRGRRSCTARRPEGAAHDGGARGGRRGAGGRRGGGARPRRGSPRRAARPAAAARGEQRLVVRGRAERRRGVEDVALGDRRAAERDARVPEGRRLPRAAGDRRPGQRERGDAGRGGCSRTCPRGSSSSSTRARSRGASAQRGGRLRRVQPVLRGGGELDGRREPARRAAPVRARAHRRRARRRPLLRAQELRRGHAAARVEPELHGLGPRVPLALARRHVHQARRRPPARHARHPVEQRRRPRRVLGARRDPARLGREQREREPRARGHGRDAPRARDAVRRRRT